MAHQAGSFEQRPPSAALPFGRRWHLEVSPHTYLLIEWREAQTGDRKRHAGVPETRWPQVEIDLLNLGSEWDLGFVLKFKEAEALLAALEGRDPVSTPNWVAGPGWLTLRDPLTTCQFELTPPIRAALILRLQTVLKGRVAPNEAEEHR